MNKKNNENLKRVLNLLDDLISDEVEERTAELEKEVSHFKCSSARYRDIIKFLVRLSHGMLFNLPILIKNLTVLT